MLFKTFLFLAAVRSAYAECKCTPANDCWPSQTDWHSLNNTLRGKLIANQPIARPCFQGVGYDAKRCARPAPVYTINATSADDIAAGIKFAKDNNLRLVIKNTGHDVVGRSQGYGSLSIWIKHVKDGIHFHKEYTSSTQCKSSWAGSALTVGGGYVWEDVYAKAAENSVIAVGGSDKSVGVIGGYLQGGGHGMVSRDFGLATDQVLEYTVILASGEIVTASECQHQDLFMALRGGGGGTYGIVVSATIKVYPTRPVLMHTLSIVPVENKLSTFQDAIGDILSRYPNLSDEGFSGNGFLQKNVYQHTFSKLLDDNNTHSDVESGKNIMNKQIINHLSALNGTKLHVLSTFKYFPNWHAFFQGSGSHISDTGTSAVLPSRFFDKRSLISQQEKLKNLIRIFFNTRASETKPRNALLELCLVGGGKVLQPAPLTSVNPAWRKTYLLMELVETWYENDISRESVLSAATHQKLKAMKDITPGMGTYLNEADRNDPDYKHDCDNWEELTGGTVYGPLCKTN
ncbi:hypothetical protein N8T08_009472 [Aspergillus melleus]|uniref:Uncharacterized protein n=1 Tax=Aspergillus melleus TaxID=138277 RepID=A0ACC3BDN6_9EURO|nr:hypothetical protein N8T08_009472 [Aspergillus melleus]